MIFDCKNVSCFQLRYVRTSNNIDSMKNVQLKIIIRPDNWPQLVKRKLISGHWNGPVFSKTLILVIYVYLMNNTIWKVFMTLCKNNRNWRHLKILKKMHCLWKNDKLEKFWKLNWWDLNTALDFFSIKETIEFYRRVKRMHWLDIKLVSLKF